jgi:proteasome accessory factor B
VSRKSERLVNLTIALLATKRWLTKSEIFATVDGYEGEIESKERMFERDKDDLRALGISIEVGTFDPIFEDEPGYRIRAENYSLQLHDITAEELALMSMATQAWKGATLNTTALSALTKLRSIGIESDFDSLPAIAPSGSSTNPNLALVIDAISSRRTISFSYRASDLSISERVVEPYGVGSRLGHWYFAGWDLDKKALRTFRIDRVQGEVQFQGKAGTFEIPENFSMSSQLSDGIEAQSARVRIRVGKATALRNKAQLISSDGDWDVIEFSFENESECIREILWHLDDVIVESPSDLRSSVIHCLMTIEGSHG